MRCLDHVFLRGAMAVALLAFGGSGALLLPQQAPPTCTDDSGAVPMATPLAATDPVSVPGRRAFDSRAFDSRNPRRAQLDRATC